MRDKEQTASEMQQRKIERQRSDTRALSFLPPATCSRSSLKGQGERDIISIKFSEYSYIKGLYRLKKNRRHQCVIIWAELSEALSI